MAGSIQLDSDSRSNVAASQPIISALRSNWLLNAIGLVVSFCASVVLVRAVHQRFLPSTPPCSRSSVLPRLSSKRCQ